MRLRDLPKSHIKYLHPSFRNLVARGRWRTLQTRRTMAQQIKRKLLYRLNMPRVAPFYCEVCTLSSRHQTVIKNHECSMQNESRHIVSYDNEVRIAQVGFKSKAKDSWAVMERLPNPQHVNLLWKINEKKKEKHLSVKDQPISLRDLCLKSIGLPEEESEFIPWEEDYDRMSQEEIQAEKDKMKMLEKNRRTGVTAWQCNICEKIFKCFADHDDHLAEGDCMKGLCEPIEINDLFLTHEIQKEPLILIADNQTEDLTKASSSQSRGLWAW